jgi:hypothetical protein
MFSETFSPKFLLSYFFSFSFYLTWRGRPHAPKLPARMPGLNKIQPLLFAGDVAPTIWQLSAEILYIEKIRACLQT